MALTPGTRLGVYEITALLGEGGMGSVYRATDTTLGRQVAIKILPDAFVADSDRVVARFERGENTRVAFSKKLKNHAAMVVLYFMYYNFGRVHQTLRVTPAMEARIADHVWTIEEIVGLLD